MAIENFAVNTLIIPMDTTYQDAGMFKAYGLVYDLLKNGIPVKWAIQPGKAFDGTDFTATAQDIQTLAPIINHNYTGGPFIIDSAFELAALPVIAAWQALHPNVKVHRATAPFSAPIAATLTRAPVIAVEDTNHGIMDAYLNIAAIPDSLGNPWSAASPGDLDGTEIANGAFFGFDLSQCRKIFYDIFLSPHTGDSTWTDPTLKFELNEYLRLGGFLHATCHSVPSIENIAGPFLTQAGIPLTDTNKGDNGTFTVDIPDFPSAQAVSTGQVEGLPGGSFQTVYHNTPGLVYNSKTQILAHFVQTSTSKQYDFMMAGPYKNGAGAGKIVYEGGHNYGPKEPYTSQDTNLYTRFVLDSVFFSVGKPLLYLQSAPAILFSGAVNTITFSVVNKGGSPAPNTGFSVTLVPGMTYNNDATIPPTTIVGQTITWSSAALDTVQPGTVLTFTANFTPPAPVVTKLADFSTSFDDEFAESYSLDSCLTTQVEQLQTADVTAVKAVDKTFAQSGDTLTYTVTITNNGPLPALNVVFTDPLPAGVTFANNVTINGVPAPGADPSVGIPLGIIPPPPPPANTVVITWQVLVGDNTPIIDIVNQGFVDYDFIDPIFGEFHNEVPTNLVTTQIEKGELTAVKSTNKTAATVSDTITYTVVVTNTGTVPATNVIFTDTPPLGTSFIPGSVTVNGVPQPGFSPIAGFNIGNIPVGGSVTVTFQVHVDFIPPPPPQPPIAANTAFVNFLYRVNPAGPDLMGTGVSNPVITQLLTPQISIVKSSDISFANIGDTITYTAVVTNTGDVTANNVIFTDNPPAGTTFVPGSVTINGAPSGGNPSLGIPLGNMAPGASITVTFKVTATSIPVPNPTTNIATASGQFTINPGEPPRTLDFDSNPVDVTIEQTETTVVKSVDKAFAEVGETLTYTVVVTNTGTVPANNGVLSDIVPNGTTFIPGTVTINGIPSGANPNAGIPLPNIPVGGSVTVIFQVTLDTIPTPNPAVNTASFAADYPVNPQSPIHLTFESNPVTTRAEIAQVDVVKSVDKAFAEVGDILTYTVTMTNVGTVPANNAVLTDIVPNGTTFVPGSVTINGIPSGTNPNAGIPVGNIPVGGTVTVTFKVQVTSIPVPNPAVNVATLSAQYPVNPQNPITKEFNSNPVTTQVETAGVNIVKTVDKAFAEVGDVLTYTSTITNPGTVPANNVLFTDVPPNGTSFIPGTLTVNGFPTPGNPAVGINLANIPVGGTTIVTFQVMVDAIPVPNPAVNISVVDAVYPVDPNNPTPKTIESNPVTTQVSIAALEILKSADKQFVEVGDTVTFTSVITNTGTLPSTNVVFTDVDPNGTTFVPGSVTINGAPSAGNPNVGVPLPNIPAGGSVTVTHQVTVTSIPVPNPVANISTVDARFLIDPTKPPVPRNFASNPVDIKAEVASATVVKSIDKPFAEVGDVVTYTVVMTNTGTVPIVNGVLTDIVPSGTTFVPGSVTINGAPSGANPNAGIPVGNIPVGGVVTVTFQATVTSIPTPNPTDNMATLQAPFLVNPAGPPVIKNIDSNLVPLQVEVAEITSVKSVNKPFVEVGDTVTFTTTLTNTGTVPANNVVFTDNPPSGTTFIPGSVTVNGAPNAGNPSAGIPVGNLAVGASATVAFSVTVDSIPVPNPTVNIGTIDADFPINPGQPPVHHQFVTNPVDVRVEIAQLNTTKAVDKAFAEVGDTLTYTINVTNTGTVAANNIVVTDAVPNGTSFIGGTVTVNGVPAPAANPASGINVGTIPAGGSAAVTFQVHVDFVPVPNPASNIAVVTGSFPVNPANPVEKTFETNPADTRIEIARLEMVKSVDKPIVNVGDVLTYTVIISNTGTVPSNNTVFTDTPPAGTTFVPGSVTINGLPSILANPAAGINLGTIPAGGNAVVTFQVTVDAIPTPNPTINIAAVTGSFPVNPNNPTEKGFESNPVPVQVELARLETIKSADKPFAEIGETVTYTVEVRNTGTVTAQGVVFTDTPPAGTAFVPGSVTINGIPVPGDPTAGVPLPDIPAGTTVTVTFKVTVVSVPTPNPSVNIAVVDASFIINPAEPPLELTFPSNPVDETIIKAQLDVVKSVDKTGAVVGDTLTYTVAVTNTGNVNADNVVVFDLVPAGTVFIPNSVKIDGTPQPGVNPNNGVPLGTLTPGESRTITFDVTVISRPTPPDVINSATAEFEYIVNPAEPPRSKTQESNEVVTRIEIVKLELVKSANRDVLVVGDTITYTIAITNTGTVPVNNVFFTDEIPAGTVYVENSFTIGGVVVPGANPAVGVPLGTINPGQTVTVTFQVRIDEMPCPPIVINIATAEFRYRLATSGPVLTGEAESNEVIIEAPPQMLKQFSVEEYVDIPRQKPTAEDILDVNANVVITDTHIIRTPKGTSYEGQILTGLKLIVEGRIVQKVVYIANDAVQSVHAAEFDIPFSTFIILPEDFKQCTPLQVEAFVEDVFARLINGRRIFKNITLRIEAKSKC